MKTLNRFGLLTITLSLVMAGASVAQDEPPSQFEHIKGLQPFVGVWQGEIPAGEDMSGTMTANCRFTANRSYLTMNLTSQTGEERMHAGTIIIGYDAPNKELKMWAFWPDRQAFGKAALGENTLSYSAKGTLPDGTESSAEVMFEVDGEEMTVKVMKRRQGDQELPDMDLVFKKRQRSARGR